MLITGDDKDGKVIHDAGIRCSMQGILIAVKRWSMTASDHCVSYGRWGNGHGFE